MAKSTELTWRDTRGQMVAVPTTNRVGFRGQIELSQRLARFSARVGINNYLGMETQESQNKRAGVRRMRCSCCDGYAGRFAQWWNRDTGYGVCGNCVAWFKSRNMPDSELEFGYGRAGVHYATPEQWAEIVKEE